MMNCFKVLIISHDSNIRNIKNDNINKKYICSKIVDSLPSIKNVFIKINSDNEKVVDNENVIDIEFLIQACKNDVYHTDYLRKYYTSNNYILLEYDSDKNSIMIPKFTNQEFEEIKNNYIHNKVSHEHDFRDVKILAY